MSKPSRRSNRQESAWIQLSHFAFSVYLCVARYPENEKWCTKHKRRWYDKHHGNIKDSFILERPRMESVQPCFKSFTIYVVLLTIWSWKTWGLSDVLAKPCLIEWCWAAVLNRAYLSFETLNLPGSDMYATRFAKTIHSVSTWYKSELIKPATKM